MTSANGPKPDPRVGLERFIQNMPKAELHVHLEGTLTPELRLEFARRNGLDLPYRTVAELQAAQSYSGGTAGEVLKRFLDAYYQGLTVLQTEQDFFDATYQYLERCHSENTVYVELSFDPQAHTDRGVAFEAVVAGIDAGRRAARDAFEVECNLIMCINRDRSAHSAEQTLDRAKRYRDLIVGLGLDSLEKDNPPIKFERCYQTAREQGYRLTAHCDVDQENSLVHIRQCVERLHVERIDHGVNVVEDPKLAERLRERGVVFTACPTWRSIDSEPRRVARIQRMVELGLNVKLNTDDPGLFPSAMLNTMLPAVAACGGYQAGDMARFIGNAFRGSWLPAARKEAYLGVLENYLAQHAAGEKI